MGLLHSGEGMRKVGSALPRQLGEPLCESRRSSGFALTYLAPLLSLKTQKYFCSLKICFSYL